MSIYGAMNTAKMALVTQQTALQITGQNMANVNNPNFTRQEVLLEAAFPIKQAGSPGMIGTGVRATAIIRRFDSFLEGQRLANNSTTGYWDARQDLLSRMEVTFNETSEFGLNNLFDNFFLGWQELSFNPQGLTERTNLVGQAQTMTQMFAKVNQDIKNLRIDLDTKITSSVTEINELSAQIAKLNEAIHEAETFNVNANDLRDKRDKLIRDLSEYVDVTSVEGSNKQVMVAIKGGRPLVIDQTVFNLSTTIRPDDALSSDIYWTDAGGSKTKITNEMTNGQIGAWVEMRDTQFPDVIDKLDLVAATMIRDINKQHSAGYGLDGSSGTDFFTGLSPESYADRDNTGTATVSASIVAPDNVNLHKFRISYASSGSTLTIRDLTRGVDVATEAGYSSGANISYFQDNGMNVAIDTTGISNGDKFVVHAANDASLNMAVNSSIVSDTDLIAAGETTNQGDGSNALTIAQLQDTNTLNKDTASSTGTATFSEFYNSIVGSIGVSSREANANYNQQEAINFELDNRREQVSGVSLDEEMINLIKFQRAYQASSRMIGVIDELLQTLVALGR
ncbi:Flagellar hook-associated protein FlgK [hydrothermal vent metagenome]|uniref:Flagellar hook-associated protein FlgK n=1 Tax=hydrothermal vent metagenome TaxID=652676 RepID=A0A3B1BF42_9ZZZZ